MVRASSKVAEINGDNGGVKSVNNDVNNVNGGVNGGVNSVNNNGDVDVTSHGETVNKGSPWTGNMHPQIGFPDNCNITRTGDCSPTYQTLNKSGVLWPCPDGNSTEGTCGADQNCMVGTGDNPICDGLSEKQPCCCAKQGCRATPQFNWVIGVCKGDSCACGSMGDEAPSCGAGKCGKNCNGTKVPCCFGEDVTPLVPTMTEGTHAKVNYIAAYDFNPVTNLWEIAEDSSFNTDGSLPTYDLLQPYGGFSNRSLAWLAPQPGGAVFWSLGYYPAGVRGVGGKGGVMFVLSTEDWFWGTWYMLNQLTIDRGPGGGYPKEGCKITSDNCWAAGNAGEMDFLEPGWNNPKVTTQASFATQDNQVGRCFQGGVNGGGFSSQNYVLTEESPLITGALPEPVVYVAVVDSVGNWVYRIPTSEIASIWPGLDRTTAGATLQAAPLRAPDSVNPGTTPYAGSFASNCQATNYNDAQQQECAFNGQQGFCGNWWSAMNNTGQPLFPNENCVKDVRGEITMPWCSCMVGKGNC